MSPGSARGPASATAAGRGGVGVAARAGNAATTPWDQAGRRSRAEAPAARPGQGMTRNGCSSGVAAACSTGGRADGAGRHLRRQRLGRLRRCCSATSPSGPADCWVENLAALQPGERRTGAEPAGTVVGARSAAAAGEKSTGRAFAAQALLRPAFGARTGYDGYHVARDLDGACAKAWPAPWPAGADLRSRGAMSPLVAPPPPPHYPLRTRFRA